MGRDEVGTLRVLTDYRAILSRLVAAHRGRIFTTAGDSVTAEFASAVDALSCALDVQAAIAEANAARPEGERMQFRIGLHLGDIIVQDGDLFGDGVNIAARLEAVAAPAPRLSIVVLPFANLSNDADQQYFVDGITEDLTTDLSRIAGSFVISRNTAFRYAGKTVDAKQIGRELGVRYVLEGSVRRAG